MKTATEVKKVPSRPVVAGGIAGSITVILVWGIGFFDVTVPPEIASAITTLIAAVAAHVTRD